jgi:hypothetical protein
VSRGLVGGEWTYARQPDRARANVEVDEVVHDTALEVILDAVDDDLLANVHDLEVGVVILVTVLIDALVNLLVVANAVTEVESSLIWVLALVVWAGRLDVADVAHNEGLLVAFRLDEHDFDTLLGNSVHHPLATLFGAICRIEDADYAALSEPGQHIGHCSLRGSPALSLALGIVGVEEIGCRLRGIGAAVVAHVKRLGGN